jgi:hypothetical protein
MKKLKGYLCWPWTPWILIYVSHSLHVGRQSGHYVNGHLTLCTWFDWDNFLFSFLALIPLWFIWQKQRSDGVAIWVRLGFSAAVVVAAIHLFVNGLGLVGPSPCPS